MIKGFLVMFFVFLLYLMVKDAVQTRRHEKRLKEIYDRRNAYEERRMRLIMEKPDYIILASELESSHEHPLNFIGNFESLKDVKAVDKDVFVVADTLFYHKDGKDYEIVDDISHSLKLKREIV